MSERARAAVDATVRQALPELPYLGLLPARVLQDHGDQTVDLAPLDPRLPLMTKVPYEQWIAGSVCRVKPEAVVLVGFEGGDMTRPYCFSFRSGDLDWVDVRAESRIVFAVGTMMVRITPDRIDIG